MWLRLNHGYKKVCAIKNKIYKRRSASVSKGDPDGKLNTQESQVNILTAHVKESTKPLVWLSPTLLEIKTPAPFTFAGWVYRRCSSEGSGAVKGWWADSNSLGFSSFKRKSGKSTTHKKWNAEGSRSGTPLSSRRSALMRRTFPNAEH